MTPHPNGGGPVGRSGFLASPTLLLVLLCLVVIPASSLAQGQDSDLVLEQHWIDIIQQDDGDILLVKEQLWLNNTGQGRFNQPVRAWVPDGAELLLTPVCALNNGVNDDCFRSTMEDDHGFTVDPFEKYTPFLSYFGLEGTLGLIAEYDQEKLRLNQTLFIGNQEPATPVSSSDSVLKLNSTRERLALKVLFMDSIAKNLTLIHEVQIENLGHTDLEVDLSLVDLPGGWGGQLFDQQGNSSITLAANETSILILHVRLPNYMMQLQLEYAVKLSTTGNKQRIGTFDKQFEYNTSKVEFLIYALPGGQLGVEGGWDLYQRPFFQLYNREVFLSSAEDVNAGDQTSLDLMWTVPDEPDEDGFDWAWVIGLIVVVFIFSLPLIYQHNKRKYQPGEGYDDELEEEDGEVEIPVDEGTNGEDMVDERTQAYTPSEENSPGKGHDDGHAEDQTGNEPTNEPEESS